MKKISKKVIHAHILYGLCAFFAGWTAITYSAWFWLISAFYLLLMYGMVLGHKKGLYDAAAEPPALVTRFEVVGAEELKTSLGNAANAVKALKK